MRIRRRHFLAGAGAAILLPSRSFSEEIGPGDYGYKHELFHGYYQEVFYDSGRCQCGYGECRATTWRRCEVGPRCPLGIEILVEKKWYPLTENTYQPPAETVPAALRADLAHVCAYKEERPKYTRMIITCAIINMTGT